MSSFKDGLRRSGQNVLDARAQNLKLRKPNK